MRQTILNDLTMDNFDQWYEQEVEGKQPFTLQQEYAIQDLLEMNLFTDRELSGIRLWLSQGPTFDEAEQFIAEARERIPNQVTHGSRLPSQREISKHVKYISGL